MSLLSTSLLSAIVISKLSAAYRYKFTELFKVFQMLQFLFRKEDIFNKAQGHILNAKCGKITLTEKLLL